jgi:hypothetical protein
VLLAAVLVAVLAVAAAAVVCLAAEAGRATAMTAAAAALSTPAPAVAAASLVLPVRRRSLALASAGSAGSRSGVMTVLQFDQDLSGTPSTVVAQAQRPVPATSMAPQSHQAPAPPRGKADPQESGPQAIRSGATIKDDDRRP